MNILITGVNGFIGKHLFSSLKNHNLIGIDLNESDDIIKCDILDKKNLSKLFEKNKFDLCIHLASLNNIQESIDYPKLYYKNILEGTHNLLLECSIYNTKFIFASTWMVYETNDNKLNENSLVNPKNTFVSAKLSCEYLVNTFNSSYDIDTVVLRIFNTYGPGKKYGVVYHFLNKKVYPFPL